MQRKPNLLHLLVFLQFGIFSMVVTLLSVGMVGLLLTDFWFPGWMGATGFWMEGSLWMNLLLVLGFAVQHSFMARSGFKKFLSLWMPAEVERHVYVMWSGFFLLMVGALWHRDPVLLLDLRGTALGWGMLGLSALGWIILLLAVASMDGLELLGIRQLAANLRGKPLAEMQFNAPGLYRYVRHPLYLGLVVGFWASPCYTRDSLLFAASMTAYILIGIRFEERDLHRRFGAAYADYVRQVPTLFPWWGRRYRGTDGA